MRVSAWCLAAIVILLGSLPVAPAVADVADVIAATYGEFSVSPPTPASVFVCHGFGCKYRSEVALTDSDRATLAHLLAAGKSSAAAERTALGKAGAWFDRRIGPAAGTRNHIARAGYKHMYEAGQLDCIDASRNTTGLLLLLTELKLLRHHEVDAPVARGFILDGVTPHVTAVLSDKKSGEKWAVDSWVRGYGVAPEIIPLSLWEKQE